MCTFAACELIIVVGLIDFFSFLQKTEDKPGRGGLSSFLF